MHILDAAYHVIHDYPGGADSLAPRVGKTGTTLNHEAKRTGQAKLGLETAVKLSALTGDLRILEAFALACDCMVVPLPGAHLPADRQVMAGLASMLTEQAHVVVAVSKALDDNRISDNERAAIYKEVSELMAVMRKLLGAVEANHAGGAA